MSDVFISYSRLDKDFVEQLREALLAQTQEIWIDWESIPASQAWWDEIKKGIAKTNNFIIVLSPYSMASPICQMEIEYARQLKKRIIPVLYADYEREAALIEISKRLEKPEEYTTREIWGNRQPHILFDANDIELKHINFFFFRAEDDFQTRFEDLFNIIRTDYPHKEQHTTLQLLATEWARRGHDVSFLLLDTELAQALAWLDQAEDKEPVPTDLQRDYIRASEKRTRQLRTIRRVSVFGSIAAVISLVFAVGASLVGVRMSNSANEASVREATANAQVADANKALIAVTPTFEAIATQIAEGEGHIESLRLAAEAVDILNVGGNAETAALLAIRALETGYSVQADAVLQRALEEVAIQGFNAHGSEVTSVAFSPDGKSILTGGCDQPGEGFNCLHGSARLWDIASGEIVQEINMQSGGVTGVAFSTDGRTVLIGGCKELGEDQACLQGAAQLLSISSGEIVREFNTQVGGVTGVAFSPDGRSILTGGCEQVDDSLHCQRGMAQLWDIASGDSVHSFNDLLGAVTDLAFSADGRYVLTSGIEDSNVQLWDTQTGELIDSFYNGRSGNTLAANFSPDGRSALISTQYGGLQLWDFEPDGSITRSVDISASGVSALAFSPDGRSLVTGSETGLVHVWDVRSGRLLNTFNSHISEVTSVAFSPDGHFVMSGSLDGTVRFWYTDPDEEPRRFEVQYTSISAVAFDPHTQYVLAGTTRSSEGAWMWDIASGELLQDFTYQGNTTTRVAFGPNSELVLTGNGHTAKLWEVSTGGVVRQFGDQNTTVASFAFSPDGRSILLGECLEISSDRNCSHGAAQLLDIRTGDLIRLFDGHTGNVSDVAISPTGDLALTAGDDTAKLWNIITGSTLHQFGDQTAQFVSVAFSPDGRFLLTGECSADLSCISGTVRLWDAQTFEEVQQYETGVKKLAFSSDGQYILTPSQLLDTMTGDVLQSYNTVLAISPDDQYVIDDSFPARLLDVKSGEFAGSLSGHFNDLIDADFSQDGHYVVTSSKDHLVRVWSMTTGKTLQVLAAHFEDVNSIAFDPNGRYVLTGSSDLTAKLWDPTTGNIVRQFLGHAADVRRVAFSPDGRYAVTADGDSTIRFWDIETGEVYRKFESRIPNIALSPDGRYLLTRSKTSLLQWDIESETEETILPLDSARYIVDMAYSQDGRDIYFLTKEDDISLWKIRDGVEKHTLIGHTEETTSVIFSPDARYIFAGHSDGTVQIWDTVSRNIVRSFAGHSTPVSGAAFSSDGRFVVAGSTTGTIRIWDSDYHDLIRYACTRVWRDFLEDEQQLYGISPDQPTC